MGRIQMRNVRFKVQGHAYGLFFYCDYFMCGFRNNLYSASDKPSVPLRTQKPMRMTDKYKMVDITTLSWCISSWKQNICVCGFTRSICMLPQVINFGWRCYKTSKYIAEFRNTRILVQQWLYRLVIRSVVLWINGIWGWLAQSVGAEC